MVALLMLLAPMLTPRSGEASAGMWSAAPDMAAARSRGAAAALLNGKALIVGGVDSGGVTVSPTALWPRDERMVKRRYAGVDTPGQHGDDVDRWSRAGNGRRFIGHRTLRSCDEHAV